MPDAHANFATSTVATAPSPATSGTSLVVAAGEGARFPAVPFNAVIRPANTKPTSANSEIVRVTARSTDTLTITRTQESTTARTVIVGDEIYAGITKKTLTDAELGSHSTCNGRLTLTSGTPITTSDVSSASTIYFCPYKGNLIGLYNGSSWIMTTFTEKSLALSTSEGVIYDVFGYISSGTLALEITAWSSFTTRATALSLLDGVLVKSSDTTRRYLGTFYSPTANNTLDTNQMRLVWNYYNRVKRPLRRIDTTVNWSYSSTTWRAANNNSSNYILWIIGVAEDPIKIDLTANFYSNAGSEGNVSITVDAIGTPSTDTPLMYSYNSPNSMYAGGMSYRVAPAIGYHFAYWVERAPSGTMGAYGQHTSGLRSVLSGEVMG